MIAWLASCHANLSSSSSSFHLLSLSSTNFKTAITIISQPPSLHASVSSDRAPPLFFQTFCTIVALKLQEELLFRLRCSNNPPFFSPRDMQRAAKKERKSENFQTRTRQDPSHSYSIWRWRRRRRGILGIPQMMPLPIPPRCPVPPICHYFPPPSHFFSSFSASLSSLFSPAEVQSPGILSRW